MKTFPRTLLGLAALSGISGGATPTLGAQAIHRAFLENGLEVILARKEGVPLVTVEIAVRAGAFIEPPDLDGLTHLHEHMFFKANRAIPDQAAYLRRLEELGMSWNGSTSHEVVRYFFTLPADLLREGLVFMRDAIQSPLFIEEELEKERQVVIGEYDRSEATPSFHLWRAVERSLFGKYFSRKNLIGDRRVILAAAPQQLRFIQDAFYVPNNAALIIAGQFDAPAALRLAEEIFSAWERRPDPFAEHPVPEHPPLLENDYLIVTQPVQAATARVGWHGPSVAREPRAAVVADVLSFVLAEPTSRLQKELVDSGLATAAALSYYTLKHIGPITLSIETRPEKALEALRAARRVIDALPAAGTISPEEVERAKRRLIHEEIFHREKGRDFAIALGFWWSVGGTDFYLRYPEIVQGVTVDEVRAWAARYLSGHHVAAVMASEESQARHGLRPPALRAAFDAASEAGGGGLARRSLPNGAGLIVRTLDAGEVAAFQVNFPGVASRMEERLAGIEELLLRTIADRLERNFLDELNRLGSRVRFNAGADHSMIGVDCLRDGLGRSVEILAEALSRMEYLPEDIERNRARMIDAYGKEMDHPERKVAYLVNETFYPPGHPYRAYPGGTAESLRNITAADLAAHRRRLLEGRKLLIAVVGPVSPEEAERLSAKHFGELPAGAAPIVELPEIGGRVEKRLTIERRDIPTCYVLGKFRAPSPRDPDSTALQLALRILHRRLFLEVRTKRALTYAVASGMIPRERGMGYLSVSSTRPDEAQRVIFETIDALTAAPLPEEDIRAAALTFTTAEYLQQESAGDQAARLAREEILGGDCSRAFTLAERLQAVRPSDIQDVLRKYIRDVHFAVIGPAADLDRALFTSR